DVTHDSRVWFNGSVSAFGDGSQLARFNVVTAAYRQLGVIDPGEGISALDFDALGRLIAVSAFGDVFQIANPTVSGRGTFLSHSSVPGLYGGLAGPGSPTEPP